jgi:hypothetical protein
MEKRSAPLSFTIRIKAALLHRLCQALVDRAYAVGYADGKCGREVDAESIRIDPSQLRKFAP